MVDAKFFPILEENLFKWSAMALLLVISCSLIINLLGEVQPLDLRHISCFIPSWKTLFSLFHYYMYICPSGLHVKYGIQCSEDIGWCSRLIAFPRHRRIASENDDTTTNMIGKSLKLLGWKPEDICFYLLTPNSNKNTCNPDSQALDTFFQ